MYIICSERLLAERNCTDYYMKRNNPPSTQDWFDMSLFSSLLCSFDSNISIIFIFCYCFLFEIHVFFKKKMLQNCIWTSYIWLEQRNVFYKTLNAFREKTESMEKWKKKKNAINKQPLFNARSLSPCYGFCVPVRCTINNRIKDLFILAQLWRCNDVFTTHFVGVRGQESWTINVWDHKTAWPKRQCHFGLVSFAHILHHQNVFIVAHQVCHLSFRREWFWLSLSPAIVYELKSFQPKMLGCFYLE